MTQSSSEPSTTVSSAWGCCWALSSETGCCLIGGDPKRQALRWVASLATPFQMDWLGYQSVRHSPWAVASGALHPLSSCLGYSNERTDIHDEQEQESLMTDVKRVAYYIGPDPTGLEENSEERGSRLTDDSQENQQTVLLRITTTSLDPETVILPLLESGTLPVEDEEGNPIQVDVVPLIDQILSFDLKYYDGEELYDSWEDEEQIPKAIQVTISMSADADKIEDQSQDLQTSQDIQNNLVTQSTMVYLLMSANFSDPTAMTSP